MLWTDVQAVCAADDKLLQEIGINTFGDMVALRVFCKRKFIPSKEETQKKEREEKKKQVNLKSGESAGAGPSRKATKKLHDQKATEDNKKKRLE